jgi:hypothetical protein
MERLKLMFSHVSVKLLAGLWIIGWVAVFYQGQMWVLWLIPLGMISQMVNEYCLHRYVFHLTAPKKQMWFDILYQAHYGHHDFPNNKPLFFVPVWIALPVAALSFSLAWMVLSVVGAQPALAGAAAFTLIGGVTTFLFYEWFHMTAHWGGDKIAIEKYVTRLHGQHHYLNYHRWYHVSPGGELIDRVMGTAVDRKELKKQGRVNFLSTLGLKPDDPRLVAARARFASKYGLTLDDVSRAAKY